MKIISWNVNSIRARLEQVVELIKEESPCLLCLQETKIIDNQFPHAPFSELGYYSYFKGIPSYNGVAIISQKKLSNISSLNFCGKKDARHISAKQNKVELINVYVPAGGEIPDPNLNQKFEHKLTFLDELNKLLNSKKNRMTIVCGDLNVAPHEDDVWSHKSLQNVISHTEIERETLKNILESNNFIDAIRFFLNSPKNIFTWWSYRSPNFEMNNRGRRLDHIWVSKNLLKNLKNAKILKNYRKKNKPSDHVPICLELNI